jgi:flagellar hook-associated protein 3 FlgL
MRLSTALIYQYGVDGVARAQETLAHTQRQIASGRRVTTPADDPVGAAQALGLDLAKSRTQQHTANVGTARDALGLDESVLAQVTALLQDVRSLAVNAGNAALGNGDRRALAIDVEGRLQQLIGLANSKAGDGSYLYGGYRSAAQPFAAAPGGAVYAGDAGVREIEVAPGRTMALGASGAALFEGPRNGNGTFTARAGSGNVGAGVVGAGTVVDPAALTGHAYEIRFSVAAGVTTYAIVDLATATTLSSGNSYVAGAAIGVAGMQATIGGAPADGDAFTLAPSTAQSVFATLAELARALSTPASGAAGSARVGNDVARALADLDAALEHVLAARADIGARLRELDTLAASHEDAVLRYDETLSSLRDLDYNRALADFARQQLALEAAQKSFARTAGLSLFDYL